MQLINIMQTALLTAIIGVFLGYKTPEVFVGIAFLTYCALNGGELLVTFLLNLSQAIKEQRDLEALNLQKRNLLVCMREFFSETTQVNFYHQLDSSDEETPDCWVGIEEDGNAVFSTSKNSRRNCFFSSDSKSSEDSSVDEEKGSVNEI